MTTEAPENAGQRTFDWMADENTMEVTEGIKFDPEVEYNFELTNIEGKEKEKDGKLLRMLRLTWTELVSGVNIGQTHFIRPKVAKNVEDSAKSDTLVKLALALGYKVDVGEKAFHPKNFLRQGMKITAHVKDQVDNKTGKKTGFSEIDIATIKLAGKRAQQQIGYDDGMISKWNEEVAKDGIKTKEQLVQKLAMTQRSSEIPPLMEAAKAGLIKFSA